MKEALKKATLELGRVVVLAIIPILITSLEAGKIDWKVIAVVGVIAGLRWVDKFLHNLGEVKGMETFSTGLTRF